MKKEFLEFIISNEGVPQTLNRKIVTYLSIELHPKMFLIKFYTANFLGGMITLFLCPQFGFGSSQHSGIFHYVLSYGPVWCGIFCAGIFFIGAGLFSLLILNSGGREWVYRHKISVIIPWISFVFFSGMLLQDYAPSKMHHANLTFYSSWYISGLVLSLVLYKLAAKIKKLNLKCFPICMIYL